MSICQRVDGGIGIVTAAVTRLAVALPSLSEPAHAPDKHATASRTRFMTAHLSAPPTQTA